MASDAQVTLDRSETAAARYVYGIVRSGDAPPTDVAGVAGTTPSPVTAGEVAAVVSVLEDEGDVGTPEDLVAHSAVLDRIAGEVAVLPMRFGIIVPDDDALREEVLAEPETLLERLDALDGTVQYTLRVRYEQDIVLSEMISSDPRLADLKDTIAGTTEDETRSQRIELGEAIVKNFDRLRDPEGQEVLDAILPYARHSVTHEIGQADDVVDVAFLVVKDDQERFEAAVEKVAADRHPRMRFRLLGPQAPYDFVKGEL